MLAKQQHIISDTSLAGTQYNNANGIIDNILKEIQKHVTYNACEGIRNLATIFRKHICVNVALVLNVI